MSLLPRSGPPASRIAKKQVTAYLSPELDTQVRNCAQKRGDTLQQFLGRAINAELEARGIAAILSTQKQHQFIRVKSPAQPRIGDKTPATRRGRRLIAGWFDRNEVNRLTSLCAELGTSIQELAEAGLVRLLNTSSAA